MFKHGFYENNEEIRPIEEIGQRLQKIGSLLSERGNVKLGSSQVKPTNPCLFIIRYERMPRGELSMKLELKWSDNQDPSHSLDNGQDIPIE